MANPPVSIIIGFHSGTHILRGCIQSLLSTAQNDDEIILVINSPDPRSHSIDFLTKQIQCIHIHKAIGHAAAINLGAKKAKHEWLILADFDLIFLPGWRNNLWKCIAQTNANVAIPLIINPLRNSVSEFGIAYTHFNGAHPFRDLPINHPLVTKRHEPQAACSCGMMIKRVDFEMLGGLDESLGTMYTDVDLSLRLRRLGGKIVGEPLAQVYHFGGWTAVRDRPYKDLTIKADHKGAFSWRNADILKEDLDKYYMQSASFFENKMYKKYIGCMMMNVANPKWYLQRAIDLGIEFYEIHEASSGRRDAEIESLFDLLGYHIMIQRSPIVYFIDRFVSLKNNAYWWSERQNNEDIVIDRNANILAVHDALQYLA